METSESITKIAPALVAAQKKIEGAVKDSENPYFSSKYADLASVMAACKGPLNESGIVIVQTTRLTEPGHVALETTLLHESGEWIQGTLVLPTAKNDPQAAGSAITYARRYALAAIIGVCPEDDDGEAAMARPASKAAPAAKVQPKAAAPVKKTVEVPKGLESRPGEFRPAFGSGKDRRLADLSDKDLDWYYKVYSEGLVDPTKARWKQQNQEAMEAVYLEQQGRASGALLASDPLEEILGNGKGKGSVAHQKQPPVQPDKAAWTRAFREAGSADDLKGLIQALKINMEAENEDNPGPYTELFRDRDIVAAFTKRDLELRNQ